MNTAEITPSKVMSVYSGRNFKCCCGCSGKHYTNSEYVEMRSRDRGYLVEPNEVNDRMVKRVITIIKQAKVVEKNDFYVATVVGQRLYIAYFKA